MKSSVRLFIFVGCLLSGTMCQAASWNPANWFNKSKPAYPPTLGTAPAPTLPRPKVQLPKFPTANLPRPQFELPELPKPRFELPEIDMPSFGNPAGTSEGPGIVDRWNQGLERTKRKLTLPKISPPSFSPPSVDRGEKSFSLNPFKKTSTPSTSNSLLPKWPSSGDQTMARPRTAQEFLGQPRPQ